jgi:hypothetical protein
LTLICLSSSTASILGVEYLQEVLFDGRYLLLLLEVLVDVPDPEIRFQVVPLLVGLIALRENELLDLELAMHVLKVLVERVNKQVIVTTLDRRIHVVLADIVVEIHIIKLETKYFQMSAESLMMCTCPNEDIFNLLCETRYVQRIHKVKHVHQLISHLCTIQLLQILFESFLGKSQTLNINCFLLAFFSSNKFEHPLCDLMAGDCLSGFSDHLSILLVLFEHL